MDIYELFSDGACHGNPGPAAIGAVIYCQGKMVCEISEAIGKATNNVAEYQALIRGLEKLQELSAQHIRLRMDSELLYYQLKGTYKVKHPNIVPLHQQAKSLLKSFKKIECKVIPREQNAEADRLAGNALKKTGQDSCSCEFIMGEESPSSEG